MDHGMLLWCTEGSEKHDELPCFHFIKCHEAAFWVCTPVWFFRSNSGHAFATSEVGLTLLCCWLSRVLTTGFFLTWCSRTEWPSFCLCQQEFNFRQVAFWGAILSGKVVGLSWCKVIVRRHKSVGQKKMTKKEKKMLGLLVWDWIVWTFPEVQWNISHGEFRSVVCQSPFNQVYKSKL